MKILNNFEMHLYWLNRIIPSQGMDNILMTQFVWKDEKEKVIEDIDNIIGKEKEEEDIKDFVNLKKAFINDEFEVRRSELKYDILKFTYDEVKRSKTLSKIYKKKNYADIKEMSDEFRFEFIGSLKPEITYGFSWIKAEFSVDKIKLFKGLEKLEKEDIEDIEENCYLQEIKHRLEEE